MEPREITEYYVFLASPGDTARERDVVREFFDEYNRHTAAARRVRFTVVDWENCTTIGVGRPQELITEQTLKKFESSLVLLIGIMSQRFGSPTGTHESGTEEEFEWAVESHRSTGFPEIKWFFRDIKTFQAPADPNEIEQALGQWKKVRLFKERLEKEEPQVRYLTFVDLTSFKELFRKDMSLWLNDEARPWNAGGVAEIPSTTTVREISTRYYEQVEREFQWLDIGGIDVDKAIEIPLSRVYVRLQVIEDRDDVEEDGDDEVGTLDIHGALGKYKRLVVVGDPGSGKSTFLRFVALMLSRARVLDDSSIAVKELGLVDTLPIPFFVSLWDLADFIKRTNETGIIVILNFIREQLSERGIEVAVEDLQNILAKDRCCLLFDGIDEVPTEQGRAKISRLVEDFVGTYPENRYVVTSRVRGYVGDSILKADFVRCDIQDLTEEDRREFLTNWFGALLGVSTDEVLDPNSESHGHLEALSRAIEEKDRIRQLAVNPLLLTVIAIVHWNRRRLPEQRVELYDECIDVLLGQRKAAERIRRLAGPDVFDEVAEEESQYDRAWIRKRFSEIALHILKSGEEEIHRESVIELLCPRFIDRGAATNERAESDARTFLDRQELRSGLLVSRRYQSCRFVHLTFQEYLAGWNLSTLNIDALEDSIRPHLRDPNWFETLQLLGGELARNSDDKLDKLIRFLLDSKGEGIENQVPLVVLCAGILRDTEGVASIKLETYEAYKSALRNTLGVFDAWRRAPYQIQMGVLRGLSMLGAPAKDAIMIATRSGNGLVRATAVRILAVHLSDDDLFNMVHILNDPRRETVMVYLEALIRRDYERTATMLQSLGGIPWRATMAYLRLCTTPYITWAIRGELAGLSELFLKETKYTEARHENLLPFGLWGVGMKEKEFDQYVSAWALRFPKKRFLEELLRGVRDAHPLAEVREDADFLAKRIEALWLMSDNGTRDF